MRFLTTTIALTTSPAAAIEIRRTLNVSGVKAIVTEEIDGSFGVNVFAWDVVKAIDAIQALSNGTSENVA